MLKGQELINWWGEAHPHDKDALIDERVFERPWDGNGYTSSDSPRRLVEEVERKTIEMVGANRWIQELEDTIIGLAPHYGYNNRELMLNMASASASTRCPACLLALEDQP